MMELHPTYCPKTLCEVCANACGFCPWSEKGNQRPVPGWDAIRSDLKMQVQAGDTERYVESYIVLRCPLFQLEEHNRWAYERFDPEKIREKIKRGVGWKSDGCSVGCKKVRCLDTGIVYPSVRDAAISSGSTEYSIRAACIGLTRRTRKGARWEYITEESEEVHHD